MAQPSSTQPEPQTTVAKSDADKPEQPVQAVTAQDDAAKVKEGSESPKPAQTEPVKPQEAPAATTSEKPAETKPEEVKPADSAAPAKAPEPPAAVPTAPEENPSGAPTVPNISASDVKAALQASQPAATPTQDTPPPKAAEPAKKGEPSFLYVEDDPFSREVITRLIKQNMGFPNLTVFADSSDFMSRVKNLPAIPDVFLLDIQISPLNGHQMLKLLRDDETFKQSKIIALTASVMASEVKQLQDAGFDGLIGKPVMKRVFPELLQKVLDGEAVWYVS